MPDGMYRSCLVCRAKLGAERAEPRLPVGERIAFAPADGRLWVVCTRCGEWNLAPIRRRWEAIEAAEQLYAAAREKASSDVVAVAEADGVSLVRVGEVSELPTLRYASRLRQRSRRAGRSEWVRRIRSAGVGIGSAALGGLLFGPAGFFTGFMLSQVVLEIITERGLRMVAELRPPEGADHRRGTIRVTMRDLRDARLVPVDDEPGWKLRVRKGVELEGDDAVEAVRTLCPLLNRTTAPRDLIESALKYIDRKGGTLDSVFAAAARRRGRRRTARVAKLDPHIRLALEMLASAESENRALSGDLRALELAWQRADTLAAIEDDLAFELGVVERLRATE